MARAIPSAPVSVYASAARTATPTVGATVDRHASYRGILVQIDVTAVTSTPSTVFTVQDAVTDDWADVLASTAIATTGTTNLVCHPDAADRANVSENTALRSRFRVKAVHGNANSMTYSVNWFPLP